MTVDGKNTYTLAIAGDTSLGDYYMRRLKNGEYFDRLNRDPISFFSGVYPLVNNCDHLIVNLETVLADNPGGSPQGKKYCNWDHPQRTLEALKKIGVTAVSLANNHSVDFGPGVLMSTLEMLDNSGIKVFGAGKNSEEASKPLKIELKGNRVGLDIYLIACMQASERYRKYGFFAGDNSPGVNALDTDRIKNQVASLRQENPAAVIIILPHWQGQDYRWLPTRIRQISRDLQSSGANCVVAHGTHMAEAIEATEKGIIAHSIGNFVFNSPGRYKKFNVPPYSLIFHLESIERETGWHSREKFYPLLTDNRKTGFNTRPVNEGEAEFLLKLMRKKTPPGTPGKLSSGKDRQGNFFYMDYDKTGGKIFGDKEKTGHIAIEGQGNTIDHTTPVLPDLEINTYDNGDRPFSTREHLAAEFEKHGYTTSRTKNYLRVTIGNEEVLFLETESSLTSLLAWRILKNKVLARTFFKNTGLSVARGRYFGKKNKVEAKNYALKQAPCVIKPSDGRKGKGITVGVKNEKDFEHAWEYALENCKKGILVEKQFVGGTDARYLVVDGRCIAVYKRIIPAVCGNGVDTIEVLINHKNRQKEKNPHLYNKLIEVRAHILSTIENQGYNLQSVPPEGKLVILDWKASISTGADTYDYTDEVHPSFKKIAEKAASAIPGLDIVGVDILARDHKQAPSTDNYIIIEANTRPGIGGHHYPAYGKPRNVAGEIAKYIIKKVR